ncbi:DNA recombination protein RmuC [Nocardia camponoti]|nr:DNA recombination protein RmuC [Nocardia camponoti]
MTASMLVALVLALLAGFGLGWLSHSARAGTRVAAAEARLSAASEGQRLLEQSLQAANEDAARRHSSAVAAMVGPLRDAVGALESHITKVEHDRVDAYSGLREQVAGMQTTSHRLQDQTAQLVAALRAPQVRGRWGEIQLERVVELAGMTKHCDFDTRVHRAGVDGLGASRPDLVVNLAGGRHIVVDAKVPFTAYLDAATTDVEGKRAQLLVQHAKQLRAHVDQLASKAYWTAFDPSPEFVVLFVPGDPFLDAAVTTDAGLLEYAFGRNVILATPTTLIALLRTVAFSWRQEALSRDMATVQQLGKELYTRIGKVAEHLDGLGVNLGKAVDAFNSTVGSLESRVMVSARKMHDLGIGDSAPITIRSTNTRPRPVPGLVVGDRV